MTAKSLVHRIWQGGTLALLLMITLHLTLTGFFKPKPELKEKSQLLPEHSAPGRKVIYVLFDALREDYIEWPNDEQPNLDPEAGYAYKQEKLKLFRKLAEEQPDKTLLMPLRSEMPTVTVVRIKTYFSGVLGSVFDLVESLITGSFRDDNLLY